MIRHWRMVMVVGCFGCGHSGAPPAGTTVARAARPEPPQQPALPDAAVLGRREVDGVLAQGMGRFLQRVEAEAAMEKGKFVGFRIVKFSPGDALSKQTALAPGDTVTRVNGLAIERPEDAWRAWNELKVASGLTIDFLREGALRRASWTIAP